MLTKVVHYYKSSFWEQRKLFEGASMLYKAIPLILLLSIMPISSSAAFAGAGSGGGGNGVGGLLIESYARDVKSLNGYEETIAPILSNLDKVYPGFATLIHAAMEKLTWYVVPAELKPRSEEILGLPFSSEQIAVQGDSEIFIDEKLFSELGKKSGVKEQGKLLLHEIVLASLKSLGGPFGAKMDVAMRMTRKTTTFLFSAPGADFETLKMGLKNAGWDVE